MVKTLKIKPGVVSYPVISATWKAEIRRIAV
jgi:hypothetical protein